MTRVIDIADPARGDDPNEFQGYQYDASVSFIVHQHFKLQNQLSQGSTPC